MHAEQEGYLDMADLRAALAKLPDDQREALILVGASGFSYEEAAELAYFGAKVLHPKTIKPAVDNSIPVRVCNTFEPNEIGTMVLADSDEAPNKIKSIAHKKKITILRIKAARIKPD